MLIYHLFRTQKSLCFSAKEPSSFPSLPVIKQERVFLQLGNCSLISPFSICSLNLGEPKWLNPSYDSLLINLHPCQNFIPPDFSYTQTGFVLFFKETEPNLDRNINYLG